MNDFIFSNEQYSALNQGYNNDFSFAPFRYVEEIEKLIFLLNLNTFSLPAKLRQKCRLMLEDCLEILSITHQKPFMPTFTPSKADINLKNPFIILLKLNNILNFDFLNKSPIKIIADKINKIILNIQKLIINYFLNKF